MKEDIYRRKFEILRENSDLSQHAVDCLSQSLLDLNDRELININPLSLARKCDLSEREVVDIFVHAAANGLLNFEWKLLCPVCGGIIHNHDSIGTLKDPSYHCVTCDISTELDLGTHTEVSFSLAPEIGQVDIDPFSNYENYRKVFFSGNHRWSEEFANHFYNESMLGFFSIKGGEGKRVTFTAKPGLIYRVSSPDSNAILSIAVGNEAADVPTIIDAELTTAGFTPNQTEVKAGKTTLSIKNRLSRICGVTVLKVDLQKAGKLLQKDPPSFESFLTGKDLLNYQSFRNLYRMTDLPRNLQLKVSNLTILFTDLKGSTEMYERIGDVNAFDLVQKHFDHLYTSTVENNGAIVKTIGDAIMATFSNPGDAVRAVAEMMKRIERMNQEEQLHNEKVAIKVGLHSGNVIAVSANDTLDYFGQTVNTAARVQGLAEGNEVWCTEKVLAVPEVDRFISDIGVTAEERTAQLKGISFPVSVFRCTGW